ncbi:MAG TPA: class I SAM-dependent methyltransferase [Phycisphaerales bacterium]|nr:class I SAM-dependent methyltransferase [Phycisphaerales bacterium]
MAATLTATTTHPASVANTAHFESVYADAQGDMSKIRWADGRPNPAMVKWLNENAHSLLRCGSRVCVVGCGLGHDAAELSARGYEVTAFDCSGTAIEWAKRIHPEHTGCFQQGDLFKPSLRWRHRFDLVVEINTVQALPPDTQLGAMSAVADLVSPRGRLLIICRHATESPAIESGPPWPLTESFVTEAAGLAGLEAEQPLSAFEDDEQPPVRRMMGLFKRI